jgi:hypothetical protein
MPVTPELFPKLASIFIGVARSTLPLVSCILSILRAFQSPNVLCDACNMQNIINIEPILNLNVNEFLL